MSLKSKPHYTLTAGDLAKWIEDQPDQWWSVDGDRDLMSSVDFPCPADELAPAIRLIGKPLLVYDGTPGSRASGERIGPGQLAALADTNNRKRQRTFLLTWSDSDEEWLLVEAEALVAPPAARTP